MYHSVQVKWIKWIYLIAIVLWLVICFLLKLLPGRDWIEWGIIALPIALFALGWFFADEISEEVENYMFKTNVLTLGLIIAMPLLNWVADRHSNRRQFTEIMAVAIILSMITLLDVWVGHDKLCIVRHAESALQTMAITLLIFALYRYFVETANTSEKSMKLSTTLPGIMATLETPPDAS
jgi:MFS family permease